MAFTSYIKPKTYTQAEIAWYDSARLPDGVEDGSTDDEPAIVSNPWPNGFPIVETETAGIDPNTATINPQEMITASVDPYTYVAPPAVAPLQPQATVEAEVDPDTTHLMDNQAERDAMAGNSYLDPAVRDYLFELLANKNRDTSAEQDLARTNAAASEGKAIADARARGGFAGLGMSGAQSAIEGDIRKQVGDALTGQMLGIQDDAREDALKQGLSAAELFSREADRRLDSASGEEDRAVESDRIKMEKAAFATALRMLGASEEEIKAILGDDYIMPGEPTGSDPNGGDLIAATSVNETFESSGNDTDQRVTDMTKESYAALETLPVEERTATANYDVAGFVKIGDKVMTVWRDKLTGDLYREES